MGKGEVAAARRRGFSARVWSWRNLYYWGGGKGSVSHLAVGSAGPGCSAVGWTVWGFRSVVGVNETMFLSTFCIPATQI